MNTADEERALDAGTGAGIVAMTEILRMQKGDTIVSAFMYALCLTTLSALIGMLNNSNPKTADDKIDALLQNAYEKAAQMSNDMKGG